MSRVPAQFAGYTLAFMFLNGDTAAVVSEMAYGITCSGKGSVGGPERRITNRWFGFFGPKAVRL